MDWWDTTVSWFSDGVDYVASGIDSFLGYDTVEPGSQAEWDLFDDVSFYSIGAEGIVGPAQTAVNWLGDLNWGGALETGMKLAGSGVGGKGQELFTAPSIASARGHSSAVGGNKFSASKSQVPGVADPRVQSALQRARNSNNPSLKSALDYINPTIRSRGPNMSIAPATISRRKKA